MGNHLPLSQQAMPATAMSCSLFYHLLRLLSIKIHLVLWLKVSSGVQLWPITALPLCFMNIFLLNQLPKPFSGHFPGCCQLRTSLLAAAISAGNTSLHFPAFHPISTTPAFKVAQFSTLLLYFKTFLICLISKLHSFLCQLASENMEDQSSYRGSRILSSSPTDLLKYQHPINTCLSFLGLAPT